MGVSRSRCAPSTTPPPPPDRRHRNRCLAANAVFAGISALPAKSAFPRRQRLRWAVVGGLCGGERAGLWYCGAKFRITLKGFCMGTQAILSTMLCALGLATAPLLLLFLACRSFTPTSSPHAISLYCCLSVTGIAFRYPFVRSGYPIACKISGEFTRIRSHVRIVIAARNEALV